MGCGSALARGREPGDAGHWGGDRRGNFCADGPGRRALCGPGRGAELCAGGNHLRFCRAVLRGIRVDHSDCRIRLYLRLRHAGRVCGVDHRLGSGVGVRFRRIDRGIRLVRIFQRA